MGGGVSKAEGGRVARAGRMGGSGKEREGGERSTREGEEGGRSSCQ